MVHKLVKKKQGGHTKLHIHVLCPLTLQDSLLTSAQSFSNGGPSPMSAPIPITHSGLFLEDLAEIDTTKTHVYKFDWKIME